MKKLLLEHAGKVITGLVTVIGLHSYYLTITDQALNSKTEKLVYTNLNLEKQIHSLYTSNSVLKNIINKTNNKLNSSDYINNIINNVQDYLQNLTVLQKLAFVHLSFSILLLICLFKNLYFSL